MTKERVWEIDDIDQLFGMIRKAAKAAGITKWHVHYHGKPGQYTLTTKVEGLQEKQNEDMV